MNCCVYWVRTPEHNDIATQGYVGVSTQVKERFSSYKRLQSSTNNYLKNAIKKYGWDNLVKTVVLIADKDYCLDIEKKLRPKERIGWNLAIGGGYPPIIRGERPELRGRPSWNKGKTGVFSAETLAKMSAARMGKPPANKGVPLSPERAAALCKHAIGNTYRRGKTHTPEAIAKIVAVHKGRIHSAEERANRSASLKGVKKSFRTEEHTRKLGLVAKGKRWYNNGSNIAFCLEGNQPDGYVLGRLKRTLTKEK